LERVGFVLLWIDEGLFMILLDNTMLELKQGGKKGEQVNQIEREKC